MNDDQPGRPGDSGEMATDPETPDQSVTRVETRVESAHSLPPGVVIIEPGSEPVPGYLLDRRLGRGGFGEVWAALGPGGVNVALKFIQLNGPVGEVESRSLDLMKNIRHPHLTGISGIWRNNQILVIGMELGDCTLMDCLNEAKKGGQPGIPAESLHEYIREAAKGIDHLNTLHIAHRDIKPQNLLLMSGSVKVADFGLAKVLDKTLVSSTGSMTPAYAAPEFFNGQATAKSDQYALAISYCQLRGGRLPFEGPIAQLMAGHLTKDPDLSMLPGSERPIVMRALAKDPERRWPDCRAFAQALGHCSSEPSQQSRSINSTKPGGTIGGRRLVRVGLTALTILAAAAIAAIYLPYGRLDPLVQMRQQEIQREVALLTAQDPPIIRAHLPDYVEVDQLEPDDNSAFEILSDDRVVDLRSWKEVPPERTHELYGAISQTRRIRIRKIKPARIFQMQGRTSGSELFMRCMSAYPSREVGQKGDAFVGTERMKVRRLIIDVASMPLHEECDLRVVSTFWNSLQTDAELWFGIMGYAHSFKVSLLLIFPSQKPFSSYSFMVARTIKEKPTPFTGTKIFQSGPGRDWVYWEVPNPNNGYVYRLEWKW